MKKQGLGYAFACISMAALAAAMFIYLGYRTLDFLQLTFKDQDQILSWLGLFSTSLGALIWASVFKWREGSDIQRGIALVMVIVSLIGELALAAGDMLLNVQLKTGMQFTEGELRGLTFAAAGLAALHAIAIFAYELIGGEEVRKDRQGKAGEEAGRVTAPVSAPARVYASEEVQGAGVMNPFGSNGREGEAKK